MLVKDLSSSFNPVPKIKLEKKEKITAIKKKSSKLTKLENSRFSIITDNLEKCYLCNAKGQDYHEAFGGRNRQKSIKWGLVFRLCRKCHREVTDSKEYSKLLENKAKRIFINKYGKDKFIEEFK